MCDSVELNRQKVAAAAVEDHVFGMIEDGRQPLATVIADHDQIDLALRDRALKLAEQIATDHPHPIRRDPVFDSQLADHLAGPFLQLIADGDRRGQHRILGAGQRDIFHHMQKMQFGATFFRDALGAFQHPAAFIIQGNQAQHGLIHGTAPGPLAWGLIGLVGYNSAVKPARWRDFLAMEMLQRNKKIKLVRDTLSSGLRLGQTANVVSRTGMGWLLGRRPPLPVLMRQTFEQLGATYIKLGQFVASAPSLFPREYVEAFQGCLDDVPAVPFDYILRTLEEEFDQPISAIFSRIDEKPLASASIAQVHAATLVSGEDVVIKVQKPGVETVLNTDFNVLYVSARLVERLVPGAHRASLGDIIGDVQATMLKECDFLAEANNIEIFRAFLRDSGNEFAVAPKVYHQATTRRVLTMERLYGVPFTDLQTIRKYSPQPEWTLINALNTWMQSLVQCQFFHADVHAGNLMVLEDGRVGFIDFGIVGHIRKETWQALIDFMQARASDDYRKMAECMLIIGVTAETIDVNDLARDLRDLVESAQTMIDGPLEQDFDVDEAERFMLSIVDLGRKHGVRFPREFALLLKQLLYFDRYIQLLAPDLSPFDDSRIQLIH